MLKYVYCINCWYHYCLGFIKIQTNRAKENSGIHHKDCALGATVRMRIIFFGVPCALLSYFSYYLDPHSNV